MAGTAHLLVALLLAQAEPLEAWLSKVKKEDRAAIEKELARLDAAELADEAKFRPVHFDVGSKLGPFAYETLVPVVLASLEKAGSPKRRFALEMVKSKMQMRGSVAEADLGTHNLAIARAVVGTAGDADFQVRRWVGDLLQALAAGDELQTDPPKKVPPSEKLKEVLKGGFGRLAADKNPLIRSFAELGASLLNDDAAERLRLRAEVEHFLTHCPQKEGVFEDLSLEEARKLRDVIRAKLERDGNVLVITIACEPGKAEEKPAQLTLFYRLDGGEWIECIKDPRKKK